MLSGYSLGGWHGWKGGRWEMEGGSSWFGAPATNASFKLVLADSCPKAQGTGCSLHGGDRAFIEPCILITMRRHINIILVAGCQSVPQPNDSVYVIHHLSKIVGSVVICCACSHHYPSVQTVRGRRDPSPRSSCSGVIKRYPIGGSIAAGGI